MGGHGSGRIKRPGKNNKGKVYGLLTISGPTFTKKIKERDHYYVPCLCACGNAIDVHTGNLYSGRQMACGCVTKTNSANLLIAFIKYCDHLPYCVTTSMDCSCGLIEAKRATKWKGFT